MKFSDRTLNAVRQIPIAQVAERYTTLKRAGADYVGLSPFKQEKTPSFHVYVGSNRYVDFSGGNQKADDNAGGVIDLVMACEGLTFIEAVEVLAERHNIPIEYDGKGTGSRGPDRSVRTELFQLHELAANYFRQQFLDNTDVQRYWTDMRGFSLESAETFSIGFAREDDQHVLAEQLMKSGLSIAAIRDSGLFYAPRDYVKSASQLRLRFSGRLMIPIHDSQSRVCAFAARQIPGFTDRCDATKEAKYVNSPETPIFTKGKTVFNLHRARAELRNCATDDRFIVVEGQLDVIRLWESGHRLVVGFQGTAATADHIQQLVRFPNGLRCLMDGDTAGQKAAARLISLSLENEADIVFTPMPEGQDPDSLFKGISPVEAQTRFRLVMARALSPMAMAVNFHMPKPHLRGNLTPQGKARIVKAILAELANCPSPTTVWFSAEEVAKLLRVDHLAIWNEYLRLRKLTPVPARPAKS